MKLVLIALLTLGTFDSAYLFYTNYLIYNLPYCPINLCPPPADLVFPSYVFAILGLVWFLAGIALTALNLIKKNVLRRTWQLLGFGGAVALFSYSLAIQYYCPYCYLAQGIGIISVVLSWKWLK